MKRILLALLFLSLTTLCAHPQEAAPLSSSNNAAITAYQDSTENTLALNSQPALLSTSPTPLSNTQSNTLLTHAKAALHDNNYNQAIDALKKLAAHLNQFPMEQRSLIEKLLTHAYLKSNHILLALDSSTIAASLLDNDEEKEVFLNHVWQNLQSLTPAQLNGLMSHAKNSIQIGWLSLITILNTQSNSQEFLQTLKKWQTDNYDHPAQILLSSASDWQAYIMPLPKHITLLLPLSGPLATQGKAIRNGFFAAFYQHKLTGYAPKIQILDTHQVDIDTLYQKSLDFNADLIVGPLQKTNIEQLVNLHQVSIPVIALNTIQSQQKNPNLIQFGLSPEDEAYQAATKMFADQHQHILVISPNNAWGKRIKTAFENNWHEQGGDITDSLEYGSRIKLAHELRHLLHLDQSLNRELSLRWLLHKKLRYVPRRRQDFDAIFLVATPRMGRQILPLLRFYYVNKIPVYSTSQIYEESRSHKPDHDLDNVIFDDIPWLFRNNQLPPQLAAIRHKIEAAWPNSFKRHTRFYALGADAFSLMTHLNKLRLFPNLALRGATGTLYLESNGQIYRELMWAQIKKGRPLPLNLL